MCVSGSANACQQQTKTSTEEKAAYLAAEKEELNVKLVQQTIKRDSSKGVGRRRPMLQKKGAGAPGLLPNRNMP